MAQEALGMVETRGLTAAIEAADAMTKKQQRFTGWYRENRIRSCNCYGSRRCWSCWGSS